jgi:uncharacterized membrane protein YvlD (DUF360 family)
MKHLFRRIILNAIAIAIVAYLMPGLSYGDNLTNLLIAAAILALANAILKPFLKILLLPLNVITLGLFGWFINVIILYLVTMIGPLSINPFTLDIGGTTIVFSTLFAFIIITFALSIVGSLVSWLVG